MNQHAHEKHEHHDQASLHLTDIEEVKPALTPKQLRSQRAQERRDRLAQEKAERDAKRIEKMKERAADKQIKKDAAAKARFDAAQVKREQKAREKAADQEEAAKVRAQETAERQEGRKAEAKAQRAEARRQRQLDFKKIQEQRQHDAFVARQQRDQDAQKRQEAIEARRLTRQAETANRGMATHIRLNAEGLSDPQEYSVRGQVLRLIRENYEVGQVVPIDEVGKLCESVLYGANIRASLNKLDETAHLDTLRIEKSPLS